MNDHLTAMKELAVRVLATPPRAVIIYGSHAISTESRSDLDVLFVGNGDASDVSALREGLISYSLSNDFPLDDEVPYSNKLLASWDELLKFSDCEVFIADGQVRFTPTLKTKSFLSSPQMRQRLMINVLIQPTLTWTEEKDHLATLQKKTRNTMTTLTRRWLGQHKISFSLDSAIESLIRNKEWHGEEWLGFRDDKKTRDHLRSVIKSSTSNPTQ